MKREVLFLILFFSNVSANLFSYVPSTVPSGSSNFSTVKTISYDTSLWAPWLSIDSVQHITLIHKNSNPQNAWTMGIGKGSQIFSFSAAFGESVPPQNHPGAPWIDEVIQLVSVNREKNKRTKVRSFDVIYNDTNGVRRKASSSCKDSAYFIHQAGTYQRDTALLQRYNFSPIIAEEIGASQYSTICWPQQAHVPNIHTSEVLYWQRIQDMGRGVIEITYGIYNFGATPLDYFNLPWGSVRTTTLPHHFLSDTGGNIVEASGPFSDGNLKKIRETDGWALFTNTRSDTALALAYVFGTDKKRETLSQQWSDTYWRYGSTKTLSDAYPGVGPRDFFVALVNPRVKVQQGDFFYWRWYMIVGNRDSVITQAKDLRDSVDYGFLDFSANTIPAIPLYLKSNDIDSNAPGTVVGTMYDRPVKGTKPLFLMRNKEDSSYILTQNPNVYNDSLVFSNETYYRPYLSLYGCESLLGFATKSQFEEITKVTPTLHTLLHELSQPPSVSVQESELVINNLRSIDRVAIYNVMGQELHSVAVPENGSLRWNHKKAANFLIVKCLRNDRVSSVLPVLIH